MLPAVVTCSAGLQTLLPGEPGQFHLWPRIGQCSWSRDHHACVMRPVNNFLGQVIRNASEGKYNTVTNSSSGEVTFQKCLNSGITLFSSKNSNKSQTFATVAYQRLHKARLRRVVWLWEPEYRHSYLPGKPGQFHLWPGRGQGS